MTWDLALPSDPIEGTVLYENGDYKVIEISDRYLCFEGDREVHDYGDEWAAIAWFNDTDIGLIETKDAANCYVISILN